VKAWLKFSAVVVGRGGGRDVIVEAAVLVVEDDQHRLLPLRAGRERVVDREHEFLAVLDVRRRVVVVGLEADGVEVAEVRVDPRDRRERAAGGASPAAAARSSRRTSQVGSAPSLGPCSVAIFRV